METNVEWKESRLLGLWREMEAWRMERTNMQNVICGFKCLIFQYCDDVSNGSMIFGFHQLAITSYQKQFRIVECEESQSEMLPAASLLHERI